MADLTETLLACQNPGEYGTLAVFVLSQSNLLSSARTMLHALFLNVVR